MKIKVKDNVNIDDVKIIATDAYWYDKVKKNTTYYVLAISVSIDEKYPFLKYTIVLNKFFYASVHAQYFDIVDEELEPDCTVCDNGSLIRIAPKIMNEGDFWGDYTDYEPNVRDKFYRRFAGKILPKYFYEKVDFYMDRYYKEFQHPLSNTNATVLDKEDNYYWMQCPKCCEAKKLDKTLGYFICENQYCKEIVNNPNAKILEVAKSDE